MGNRFGLKDLALFLLLAIILVFILLLMYQVDRQWLRMGEMQRNLAEQSDDLRGLRKQMNQLAERGIKLAAEGEVVQAPAIPPAFARAQAAQRQPDYASGGWLVQAFATGLKTLTPLVSSDVYSSQVQGFVLETLLTRNPETLKWQGLLARDWQISEDGLQIDFTLRSDVRFSDGEPLSAADVAFTFAFIMDERIAAPRQRAYYEKLQSVEALAPNRVRFHFKEPYFNALALAGGLEILPEHFYRPYLDKPNEFNQSKGLLLGSGPYRLPDPKGWTPDQGLVELTRNQRYWGPVEPPFARLLWKVIENDSARLTTFRNGEIDVYSARPREYDDLRNDSSLAERARHMEYMSPTAGYTYIGWNQQRQGEPTRFADGRVRRAMTYLTDRQGIIEEIMLGYAEPAVSPFNPRSDQHTEALTPRSHDPAKAKALLAAAGYADRDGDQVLEGPDGEPFAFELVYFQANQDTERIVLYLKDLYARAGVLLKPKPSEWSVMLDKLDRKDFDAITLGWSSGVETDIYQMFHSSQTVSGGDNFINYTNPQLDTLIEQARATVEEKARMPLWQAAERILYADQPYTFLMRRKSLVFLDRRLQNLEVTRLGLNLNLVPIETYIPAAQQRYDR